MTGMFFFRRRRCSGGAEPEVRLLSISTGYPRAFLAFVLILVCAKVCQIFTRERSTYDSFDGIEVQVLGGENCATSEPFVVGVVV